MNLLVVLLFMDGLAVFCVCDVTEMIGWTLFSDLLPEKIIMFATIAALSLLSVGADAAASSYRGHSVLRCSPSTSSQMDALHEMDVNNESLDFWKEPSKKGGFVDIMVTDGERLELEHKMHLLDIPCVEMIGDVQTVIDSQKTLSSQRSDASYFESYHPPNEVFEYIENLVSIYIPYPLCLLCATLMSYYF